MLPTFKRNDNNNAPPSNPPPQDPNNPQPSNNQQPGGVPVATYIQPTYATYGQPIPQNGQPVMMDNQPGANGQPGQPMVVMTQPYAGQPTVAVIGGQNVLSTQDARLFITYKLGKIVKIFAIIDLVGVIINIIFNSLFYLILLPMPIFGMLSGRNFKVGFARVYAVFLVLEIIFRVVIALLFPETFLWAVIITLITLMILIYVRKFIRALGECSESDIQELTQNYQRFKSMDNSCC
mmetsp:Transcript_26730/g.35122  ORF Transcript_26730/g.35122 Transcript_26730/m.35122 type:complete len:236 (-) Transcript_26730:350-1057(-)